MPLKIAFVGLGVMGGGMAANLARKGFDLTVFSRTSAKAPPVVALGATLAASAAAAARGADVVFLCLPATEDVGAVLFGESGIAAGLSPGAVVIDTSTIDPVATRAFAARLAEGGVAMLDCPVSGGQKGAADGTLSCMVGGPAEVLDRVRPCLEAIATTIVHIGDAGAGQVAKACNQICVAATMLGASEAVALALALDVDPERVREALLGGAARSAVLERHALRLIARDFTPGFRARLMEKDLRIAVAAMTGSRVYAPVSAGILQLLGALVQTGRGDADWGAVGALVQELSGLRQERS
ncbi:NAD(P)-dependent oxidoreductase [Rhodoplanes sp. TEM]|uniref:NAD(P)-dependent oxidoreductase n=1 Tax=Rhodoplanes tepidamans TaxID=200616 RepID=A0ABT5JJK9_RHOTP|nr:MULTISPECIES: NAD(P)-dependent oxidoreductase [Rhodoplanes]MDC7789764.1 NAD(P)-dependent oxidoreductase [Rhodoplanes tepidamans]MDC7985202.1 NAD(P)-dependent oxidoreductase [Rhodoplanes sp. TEM]MDQ0354448.1 2-hydroxy-3-oxopropionate reductase [Rhodoplanes tepidamans]